MLLMSANAFGKDDDLLGLWWGETGTARERIEIGFEILRNDQGAFAARVTEPIANYYAVDMGALRRDGDALVNDQFHLRLQPDGDGLSGHYPGPKSPLSLRRVGQLPQHPTPPAVPTGPAPRWQTRLGGQVYASPVVHDGIAFIGTTGGVINAVQVADGKVLWAQGVGAPIHGAVAVTDDAVYVASDIAVHRFERSSGKPVWRQPLVAAPVSRVLPHPNVFDWDWQGAAPRVLDDSVYIGSSEGVLHALDATTGTPRWRFATGGKIRGAVALDAMQLFLGSTDGKLYALERASGRELWRYDTGAAIEAAPLLHEGRVYVGNRGYGLYALDAAHGSEVWKLFFWGSWVESTPVIVDAQLYVGSSDLRRVSAIDPASGEVRWRTDLFGWTFGTPLVVGDRIYAGAAGGTPYFIPHQASFNVLDRSSGRILQRHPLTDTGGHQWGIAGSPALAGDLVLVATIEGSLIAFPREDSAPR